MSRMVYKYAGLSKGKLRIDHKFYCDYKIIPEDGLESALNDGWHTHPYEAKAHAENEQDKYDDTAPPTRQELVTQAKKIGLKFKSNISDEKLLSRINEAMNS